METRETKKQLEADLYIISAITMVILGLCMIFGNKLDEIARDTSINIVLRVLLRGGFCQFGLAGLGITVVSIIRKESFLSHGLTTKNLLPTILLSALVCVPDFIYNFVVGNVHPWYPFIDVHSTAEVVKSGFPFNVLGMLITLICWGFFEGFNYVFISDKLNERFPSKYKYWDWGAAICAVMCLLIHGAVGVTPDALIEMLCTIIQIYGMLLVRKITGNGWGCVLIFVLYWNAL